MLTQTAETFAKKEERIKNLASQIDNKDELSPRQKANLQILNILETYCNKNPDIRFGQALHNLYINEYVKMQPLAETHLRDIYYDESVNILKRIK